MDARSDAAIALDSFLLGAMPLLERALVVRFGADQGREAGAEVAVFAVEHWAELRVMDNPVSYLYRVGQSYARRLRRSQRPDVVWQAPTTVSEPVDVDVQRALMRFRPDQPTVSVLTNGFGLSHREVAELVSTTSSNVADHVSRGLARLRTV